MTNQRPMKPNQQISEEAAGWFIEFRSGDIDAEGRRAFNAWVRASPEHLRAFIEMAALWSETGSIDSQHRLQIEELIARAEAETNVVVLDEEADYGQVARESGDRDTARADPRERILAASPHTLRSVRKLAAAAMILIGLFGAGFAAWMHLSGRLYSTEVGEQRSMRLVDGSIVILDSRSRLRVSFTASVRTVELLRGRALFHVAKDPTKPFIVQAGGTAVRAVGTQFDVNRNRSGTVVTVVEGRVAVYSTRWNEGSSANDERETASTRVSGTYATQEGLHAGSAAKAANQTATEVASRRTNAGTELDVSHDGDAPILLSAGDQLKVVDGKRLAEPVHANVSSATAWTQGHVVLESATLAAVAEEFNRYSQRKLVVEDRGTTPLRLSGVFATDPDFLIRYLRSRPDIVVHETDAEIDIIRTTLD